MLQGKLYFLDNSSPWSDATFHNGQYYWPLRIFPAILLMPFSWVANNLFGIHFWQGYIHFPLIIAIFILVKKLARIYNFSSDDSYYLAFAFCFASVMQFVSFNPLSWYYSHAVAVFFTFLAIYEYKTKNRMWLIGLFMAFVFMTRYTAGITSIFFALSVVTKNINLSKKVNDLLQLFLPIALAGIFLLILNHVRFGNIFDNGYKSVNNALLTDEQRFELLNYGLFQLRNIPTNFYYYFIKTVDPILVNFESLHGNTFVLSFLMLKLVIPV